MNILGYPLEFWIWLAGFSFWMSCGFFASKVAHEKGYHAGWWFLAGFFCGFIALIASVGLPDRGRKLAVGQKVSARGRDGIIIRIDNRTVMVDDGQGQVIECDLKEVFLKL